MKSFLTEACVETVQEAVFAAKNGADSLEVCADLQNDGLTPPEQLITEVLLAVDIPIKVMIRPRPGNFEYNDKDLVQVQTDIQMCQKLNINHIVFGCTKKGELDETTLDLICKWAKSMDITFHKAIDTLTTPLHAIQKLKKYNNIKAILSSGQKRTAIEGISNLLLMKKACSDRIDLIAAGKITFENIDAVHQMVNLKQYHGRRIVG